MPLRPFFERLLFAVDRVYADKTLEEFWRHGNLIPNRAHRHPYQKDVPKEYHDSDRWFLLDTNLDPPRPWDMHTNIPVFSLALARAEQEKRRWLVYAHSPLEDRKGVVITVPDFGEVTVDVPRAGGFYLIDEPAGVVAPVAAESCGPVR